MGVYVGFDNPKTLGRYETGSKAALPIFKDFVKNALYKEDFKEFKIPEGIYLTSLNYDTGLKPSLGEKNTIIDIDLRYHYNQGLGYILKSTDKGNITIETGIAFDNSDYLNTEQKTTYIRGATSIDQNIINLSLKFEIDYYYQVNESLDKTDLSRFQILAESQWNL